jgi:hypothetical protein
MKYGMSERPSRNIERAPRLRHFVATICRTRWQNQVGVDIGDRRKGIFRRSNLNQPAQVPGLEFDH